MRAQLLEAQRIGIDVDARLDQEGAVADVTECGMVLGQTRTVLLAVAAFRRLMQDAPLS